MYKMKNNHIMNKNYTFLQTNLMKSLHISEFLSTFATEFEKCKQECLRKRHIFMNKSPYCAHAEWLLPMSRKQRRFYWMWVTTVWASTPTLLKSTHSNNRETTHINQIQTSTRLLSSTISTMICVISLCVISAE